MKVKEVLQILEITRTTLYKYVKLGYIKELEEIKDEK